MLGITFCKLVAELPPLTDVRIPFPLNILRMNRQNSTKICGLFHHNIFHSFQFSVINLFLSSDSTIAGLLSGPLTTLVSYGLADIYFRQ